MFVLLFSVVMISSVTDDDIMYWSFDTGDYSGTTMYDVSGTPKNNGTCTGMVGCGTVIGLINNATLLGDNDYILLDSVMDLKTEEEWSVSIWINTSNTASTSLGIWGSGSASDDNILSEWSVPIGDRNFEEFGTCRDFEMKKGFCTKTDLIKEVTKIGK